MFYGFGKFFCSSFREIGLAYRCRSFFVWLCSVFAFSPAVNAFPFYFYQHTVPLRPRPSRYYTEAEILSAWASDPRVSGFIPSEYLGSLDSIYSWLYENSPSSITPPIICAITSTVRVVDFGENYTVSTNQLVRVGIAPSIGEAPQQVSIFPFYFSGRYGLGFIGIDGGDALGSSPAFGGSMSWGGSYGFFTTNLTTTQPWTFQDWQEPGPLVWQRQNMPDFFRQSSSYFRGSLRVMSVYYSFPEIPNAGIFESDYGGYPVTHSAAFQMLDEYWLTWWWQTVSGVYVWTDDDRIHVRNVLRFSSPSNSTDGLR